MARGLSWQTMNSGPPCSRAPQPVVGAWQLGTTALPFDFPTRCAIGFQQSGKAGTFPLGRGSLCYSSARPNT